MKPFKKYRKPLLYFLFSFVLLVLTYLWVSRPYDDRKISLANKEYFIAHAGGGYEGKIYTNSKESLLHSIEQGYKYIELDLGLTSDSILVCMHDSVLFKKISGIDSGLTYHKFSRSKIHSSLTPMSMRDVIDILRVHPFTLVIDATSNPSILNQYIPKELRPNIYVETSKPSLYRNLKKEGYIPMLTIGTMRPFAALKYILYSIIVGESIEWCVMNTTSNFRLIRLFKRIFGIKVAMYASNSKEFFLEHLDKEVDRIYTDYWTLKE